MVTSSPPHAAAPPTATTLGGAPSPRGGAAITALAVTGGGGLLLTGAADGDVTLWEARRVGWDPVRRVRDAHVTAVTAAVFVAGAASAGAALTLDGRGRLVHHPPPGVLSLAGALVGALGRAARAVAIADASSSRVGRVCALAPLPPPPRGEGGSTVATRGIPLGGAPSLACDGAVALAGEAGVLVARVVAGGVAAAATGAGGGGDARLVPLHILPPPSDAPPRTPPALAWTYDVDSGRERVPGALLATAWGRRVSVAAVPLARPATTATATPASMPPPTQLATWSEAEDVAALAWMGTGVAGARRALAVVSARSLALRDPSRPPPAGQGTPPPAVDTLDLGGALASSADATPGTTPPIAAAGGRAALLIRGAASARLTLVTSLPPDARQSALAAAGRWTAALDAALDAVAAARAAGAPDGAAAAAAADTVAALAAAALGATPPPPVNARDIADFALTALAALGDGDAAWPRLAPAFEAVGGVAPLARAAAAAAATGSLPALPPDAVAAIVDACADQGGAEGAAALDAALVALDAAALDFDAATRAAARAGATAALASVFVRALGDVATPAAVLLATAVSARRAGGVPRADAAAARLLSLLRCAFRGTAFPAGAGDLPPHLADRARAGGLGFLLHATPASVAAALAAIGADASGGGDTAATPPPPHALDALLPGPSPALCALASFQPVATVRVLAAGLAGWDALQGELCDVAAAPRPPGAATRTAAQAAADAVAALLDGRALTGDGAAAGLGLLADLVAAGRAAAPPATLHAALEHAALGPWPGGAPPPPASAREALFIRVLRAASAGPGSGLDVAAARSLARAAGFARAEAAAHDAAGDAGAALDCLLASDPATAFEYADGALARAAPSSHEWARLRSALLARAPALAAADGDAAARLVATHFPDDHAAVLAALADAPDLTFGYLRGAYAAAAALVPPSGVGGATPSSGPAALLADPGAGDAYVQLLCARDPRGVLPFLASRAAYSPHAALTAARAAGVADAQAFLLERLGDAPGAAALLAARVADTGRSLLAAAGAGPPPPAPLAALRAALGDAVGLCRRAAPDVPPSVGAGLWMATLDAVADVVRAARASHPATRSAVASLLDGTAAAAAGALPARAVGDHLLARWRAEPLSDAGRTLTGVLAAARREGGLLARAADVAAADARRATAALAAARGRALAPVTVVGAGAVGAPPPRRQHDDGVGLTLAPERQLELVLAAAARWGGDPLPVGVAPESPLHRGGVDVTAL